MKQGIIISVFIALLAAGCGQQKQLKVTYVSDPPGGTLYKQNDEPWGPCPKVILYDLNEETLAEGQLKAKGLIVRWPSGPEKRSDDPITFPVDGTYQQFTFVQPGQTPSDRHTTAPPKNERAATAPVEREDGAGLLEEPDERSLPIEETAKIAKSVDDVADEQDDAVQVTSEQVPGLHEEPDERSVPTTEMTKTAEPVNDVVEEQARQVQTESKQGAGLHEEPDERSTATADTAKTAAANDGVIEKQADARRAAESRRNIGIREGPDGAQAEAEDADLAGSGQEAQPTVVRSKSGSAPKTPEYPNVETTTKPLGDGVEMTFAKIPDGYFQTRFDPDETNNDADKNPTERVTIKSFYMGQFEVTQKQYEAIMDVNPAHFKEDPNDPNNSNRPVETVSWNDAEAFCEKLSIKLNVKCRLPSEDEWEYACQAGTTTAYYWGDDFDKQFAVTIADRGSGTENVGTRRPNAWKLYDMSGNVWEWCDEWYIDPQWPAERKYRVLRGGSWGSSQRNCRSSHCNWHTPNHRYDDCGFRIVMEVDQPSIGTVETPLP